MVCWLGKAIVVSDLLRSHCNCAFAYTQHSIIFFSYSHFQRQHYPQLYAIEVDIFVEKSRSLPNEMMMCRICSSNVSCDRGEIVSDLHYIHYVAPLVGSLVAETSWKEEPERAIFFRWRPPRNYHIMVTNFRGDW